MADSPASLMEKCAPTHPLALNEPIGSRLNFPFPKITPILSELYIFNKVRKAVNQNDEWFVSEKLDGFNVAVSSAGWVANKDEVVAHLIQEKKFGKRKIETVSVKELKPLFDKIFILGDALNREFNLEFDLTKKDQIILYGEFIVNGTSTTQHDIYENEKKGFEVGHLFVFAVGFYFENPAHELCNYQRLEKIFSNIMEYGARDKKTFFICPIDQKSKDIFVKAEIELVPLYKPEKLVDLLTRRNEGNWIEQLQARKMEGIVLHDSTNKMFKWTYQKETTSYHDWLVRSMLTEWTSTENEIKVAAALSSLYNSSREYETCYYMILFDKLYERFISEHKKEFEENLLSFYNKEENTFNSDVQICLDTLKTHASAHILSSLLPEGKSLFDKNIQMTYDDLIETKLMWFAKKLMFNQE